MYRDCRNLCQTLRALGYSRLISVQNFKRPNFQLLTDILYWLAKRFDPSINFTDLIQLQSDRVQFIKNICILFSKTTRLRLDPKKLYQANSVAVQQLLKITTILYKAYNSSNNQEDQGADFVLTSKTGNLKAHKQLAIQINQLGTKLYDMIRIQPQLKKDRSKALSFIQGIQAGQSSQGYISSCVNKIIQQQEQNMIQITKYVDNLEKQQKMLQEKIKRKNNQLQRAQKKLKTMTSVKPPHQDQQDRLQQDMQRLYQLYAQKFRNLCYLQKQLQYYNQKQKKQIEFRNKHPAEKWIQHQNEIKRNQFRGSYDDRQQLQDSNSLQEDQDGAQDISPSEQSDQQDDDDDQDDDDNRY